MHLTNVNSRRTGRPFVNLPSFRIAKICHMRTEFQPMPVREQVDIGALSDLCTPWCIHVVATLRVANHIASGITQIEDLAAACGAHAESLEIVLRHLLRKGLFAEPTPGKFTLNEAARVLLDPMARWLNLDGFGGRMAHAWGTLLSAVRTGRPAYHEAFGRPYWEDLAAHPKIAADFDALMGPAGHGIPDPEVLVNGDWDRVRTVVDVGGGTGALLAEVLRAHPQVRGVLVDLPRTIARSDEIFKSAGVADRVTTVGQSFFEPLPAGADVYMLKSVLSDWPDREAQILLQRCAEAARPAGRVVVLNGVSADEDGGPFPDLLMLVLVGGKQRSLADFRKLASASGLEVSAAARLKSGRYVVECRPKD
jgi:2,7-dihydroxy-5-methyl-1-naphthoate 7-O-methyltransferase